MNPGVFLTGLGLLAPQNGQDLEVTGWKGPRVVIWFNLLLKAGLHFLKACRTAKLVFNWHAPQRMEAVIELISPMLETDAGGRDYQLTGEMCPHVLPASAAAAKKNHPWRRSDLGLAQGPNALQWVKSLVTWLSSSFLLSLKGYVTW